MFAYIGGKSKQSKWIRSLMPYNYITYVEIFGGAMWNYINLPYIPPVAYYNDINPFLMNLWNCMKEYDKFLEVIHHKNYKLNDKETYHNLKERIKNYYNNVVDKQTISFLGPDFNVAVDYMYILTHCFSGDISGGMKLSSNGFVPLIKRLKQDKYRKKLDRLSIWNMPYNKAIEVFTADSTFLYLDPPYWGTENLYGFHNFGEEDHYKLSELLSKSKTLWMLSYYDYPKLEKLYPKDKFNYYYKSYQKSSTMNKKGEKKPKAVEILITNYK
jgi:DNA adenine methylase